MRIAAWWGRGDDGGEQGAAAGPSLGAASAGARSADPVPADTVRLQLTLWEQWA
ncbi:hypothetical protein Achl_3703 [Pseudarthrobacter chlorophenolicus A6]|uniref:Uncharacterized protein n=1 Tax=Pseudarthrobacter chlorophenolicus (strain ATCC 700700 / DSM 12829 / CIP 107037 / JCM 12360 / KCTC 9906 / NCIMB 13794 / A6) TaxID=452863 RepID=B8H756_PSECP|nr:hypothetical protein [Pseudarthrobacter chlorophenolicus]ACL41658.1 hypothetical protein Achl_3703 [Pseudarthrobacter chlorophenolicus A6]SDQ60508.1 hypothetical protein SAMN04489738_1774 [Pseudarthrobacter chlorophenolicus]